LEEAAVLGGVVVVAEEELPLLASVLMKVASEVAEALKMALDLDSTEEAEAGEERGEPN